MSAMDGKQAFIRDHALVLYFDNAETPFVARYDLESLAQANFEVADKKDGTYALTLRDFAGQTQTVGQFAAKADAHQALYAILQALLAHKTQNDAAVQSCGGVCWLVRLLAAGLIVLGLLMLFYVVSGFVREFSAHRAITSPAETAAPMTQDNTLLPPSMMIPPQAATAPAMPQDEAPAADDEALGDLPEGEAVDADSFLAPKAETDTPQAAEEAQPAE